MVEGKTKGPGAMQEGALFNRIKRISKTCISDILPHYDKNAPISRIASLHLTSKLEWFSEEKQNGDEEKSFRSDQMCMLCWHAI